MKNFQGSEEEYMESHKLPQDEKDLDAGALVVLQSKGSWLHCSYHLTTSIVAPPLLSIPYAFVFLGWTGGLFCLSAGALVTFYSYNLLSMVLEHNAQLGRRQLRPRWGKYFVGPIQFAVCYGGVVATCLLGGQCIKAIYLLTYSDGTIELCHFVIAFGGLMLILAQAPSFHSLRHINLISLIMCLSYSACAAAGSIYIATNKGLSSPHVGKTTERSTVDYSLVENTRDRIFGVYLQPTNEVLESKLGDPKCKPLSARNMIPRIIGRSIFVALATLIAAMFPFFGDIMGIIGAFGFLPLDFALPVIFYNVTFKPSKRTIIFWVNFLIMVVFSILVVVGSVAAIRQVVVDARFYRLFANL
ncbi:GABA transporter 1 [Bienertia sinuspersici]